MALNEDTEALMLAYVYGELSASDARDFERRMDAGTPEAAELRAEVESMRASRELFGKDAAFGVKSGVDLPPAHLVDAIMNAEKLARLPAVRDAALARVAPPVDKSFTAKLSRWLLGGGLAVGAAAALFIVVTQSAQEPELSAPAVVANEDAVFGGADGAKQDAKLEAEPAPPAASPAVASPTGGDALSGGAFAEAAENKAAREEANLADEETGAKRDAKGGEKDKAPRDVAGAPIDDGFAYDALKEAPAEPEQPAGKATSLTRAPDAAAKPAPDADPSTDRISDRSTDRSVERSARGRADDDTKKRAYKAEESSAQAEGKLDANLQDVKARSKDAAREPAKTQAMAKEESSSGSFFDLFKSEKKAAEKPREKAKANESESASKANDARELEKAGMRGSVGADNDLRGGAGIGSGSLGLGGAAASGSSGPALASPGAKAKAPMTTAPMAPPADAPARAMSPPPPPPAAPAKPSKSSIGADAKPQPSPVTMSTSDDGDEADEARPAPKVISREELEAQRKNVRKKSAGTSGKSSPAADAERAKRLEQANLALASAQREMAAKRWLGAFDQMALAESLDVDRALGATPLVGQMRALVELKRPVDAARVARRLGRWDVKAFDVVPGLLLGAQVAEQIGDDRLARELWTRLLEVPSERAKAQAALARMEGAKALRRQQYDSDAAEAPAAAAPASESAKE